MAESKKTQQIFQKYCEFNGTLELFAQSEGISLKSCTTWAKKYDWQLRKDALRSDNKMQSDMSDHIERILKLQNDFLKDSESLRKTIFLLVRRAEKILGSQSIALDPDRTVSMLPSLVEALMKCHDLSMQALGVGEIGKTLDSRHKQERESRNHPHLALVPPIEKTDEG